MKPETDSLLGLTLSIFSLPISRSPISYFLISPGAQQPYLTLLSPAYLLVPAVPTHSCHIWFIGLYPCRGPRGSSFLEPLGQGYREDWLSRGLEMGPGCAVGILS